MEHYKRKLSQNETILINKVSLKMESIQNKIDELMKELLGTKISEAHIVKGKIKKQRAKLIPFAYMKAAIANPKSRANYFPEHMESGEAKKQECSPKFIKFIETQV